MRVVRVVITTFSSPIPAKGAVSVILVIQGGLPIFPILAVTAEQGRLQRRVSYLVFFERFFEDKKWAHLDIAGTAWKSGAAAYTLQPYYKDRGNYNFLL